jgi:hypothetical protein
LEKTLEERLEKKLEERLESNYKGLRDRRIEYIV